MRIQLKQFLFLAVVGIVIVTIAAIFWQKNTNVPIINRSITPTPTLLPSLGQERWENVYPGQSLDDLIKQKGEPKKTIIANGSGTVSYPGSNQYWDTEVSIQNNSILFVREHVFKPQDTSLKSRLSRLKEQPVKVYGPISESGQYLFMFPSSGVGFLANEQGDTVYEVWYFKPGPLAAVLTLPAFSGYDTDPNKVVGGR